MDAIVAIREQDGTFSRSDPGVRPYYSITKTFIAAAVLRLGVPLDQTINRWFGQEWLPDSARITIPRQPILLLESRLLALESDSLPGSRRTFRRSHATAHPQSFAAG